MTLKFTKALSQLGRASLIAKLIGVFRTLILFIVFGVNDNYSNFIFDLGFILLLTSFLDYSIQLRQNKKKWYISTDMLVILIIGLVYGIIYHWHLWQFILLGILSFNQLVLFSLLSQKKYLIFERISLLNACFQLVLIFPIAIYPRIELLILSRILSPIISWIIVMGEMKIKFEFKKTGYAASVLTNTTLLLFPFSRYIMGHVEGINLAYFEYGLTISMTLYTIIIKNVLLLNERTFYSKNVLLVLFPMMVIIFAFHNYISLNNTIANVIICGSYMSLVLLLVSQLEMKFLTEKFMLLKSILNLTLGVILLFSFFR